MRCLMYLNRKFLLSFLFAALCLGGCSTAQTGFLGMAPRGDRQDYIHARDLYNEGHYTEAVAELSDYIYKTKNVKRREARAYRLLGKSYEQLGNLSKALDIYLEALEFHPDNVPLLLAAASLYQRTELTNRSMDLYNQVLQREPNNLEALTGQAVNYNTLGFYSKARYYYDRFFALNPQAAPKYRARYANTFLSQSNYQEAFIHITMALMQDNSSPDFWLVSAKAARGLQLYHKALEDINAALFLAPKREDLLANKALWQNEAGQYKESIQTAKEILKISPKNQLAFFILAMDEYNTGNPKSARHHMQAVKEQNPETFIGRVASKLLADNPL